MRKPWPFAGGWGFSFIEGPQAVGVGPYTPAALGLLPRQPGPAGNRQRDETKLFDARNSAETELSYDSPGWPLLGLGFNLIDLEPRLALPGLFLEDRDQTRRYSDFLLPQRVPCGCCSRGRNPSCLTAASFMRRAYCRRQLLAAIAASRVTPCAAAGRVDACDVK
jgi:hypothetical protein